MDLNANTQMRFEVVDELFLSMKVIAQSTHTWMYTSN